MKTFEEPAKLEENKIKSWKNLWKGGKTFGKRK